MFTLLRITCSLETKYLFSHRYLHGLGNPRALELGTVLNNVQMSIPIKVKEHNKFKINKKWNIHKN